MTHAPPRRALLAMFAGAALISTTGIFVRLADVPPTVSGFYRMLFGGLMLAALVWWRGDWRGGRLRLWWLLLLPAAAFAADLMLWHRSIRDVGPGLATLLANFQVFVMAAAGVLLYRERLNRGFVGGLALAFFGLWLLVGRDWGGFAAQYRIGVMFGILTGFAYAAYLLSFRRVQQRHRARSTLELLCISSLLCAVLLGGAGWLEGSSFTIPDAGSWAALLALALVGQVLGWWLIAFAMPQLPASLVGLLLLLQPVLAFLLDVVLFDRVTSPVEWAGVALSLLGIFLGSRRGRTRPAAEVIPESR